MQMTLNGYLMSLSVLDPPIKFDLGTDVFALGAFHGGTG